MDLPTNQVYLLKKLMDEHIELSDDRLIIERHKISSIRNFLESLLLSEQHSKDHLSVFIERERARVNELKLFRSLTNESTKQ